MQQQDFAAAIKGIAHDKNNERRDTFTRVKEKIKKLNDKHKDREGGVILRELCSTEEEYQHVLPSDRRVHLPGLDSKPLLEHKIDHLIVVVVWTSLLNQCNELYLMLEDHDGNILHEEELSNGYNAGKE
jgi:hypothetical protein